ncbi:MAG TPA: BT4734/BF3469 family protein [Prolixibacteraceae bacterium]|nr:BT4734/BF3469 family protein [Prolixibacteraceae bacterium]
MIKEKDLLQKTHYGLNIYAHILHKYYPEELVISLSGKECAPTKNPFNGDKVTLKLNNIDWVFMYSDSELPDFHGNPFSFAERHYKLSGNELLEKLNNELNLHIGEKRNFYDKNESADENRIKDAKPKIFVPKFSLFRRPITNVLPVKEITLIETYLGIKSKAYKDQTDYLRGLKDKEQMRKVKATQFDYVTFSGTFSKRNDNALLNHSGLLTIDFDHVSNLQHLKNRLLNDEYFETELLFVSPSGDGLKWIIPIDLSEATHLNYFLAVANYIKVAYQLDVDSSGKDVSRACFLPHDPEVYINPKYLNTKIQENETK